MRAPQAGDRVGNYLLDALIGTGSFGQVWKARHHVFDDVVAAKIPMDPQYVRDLRHEGLATRGLSHPLIVRVIDLDPFADPPYLIMEYVPGLSLRQVIERHPHGMEFDHAETILRAILTALQAAHALGVIHRDLKPENVLVAGGEDLDDLTVERVKLTDFGLGKIRGNILATIYHSGQRSQEEAARISGTLAYMAPEQRDGRDVDERCDLYAAGVVLFEMLTGVRPQGGDLPGQLRPGVPPRLDDVFRRCYTHLDRRAASAAELLDRLAEPRHAAPSAVAATPTSVRVLRRDPTAPASSRGPLCPRCQQQCDEGDQFCTACGQQLVDRVLRCPACKGFVQPADRYCISCGAQLTEGSLA